MIGFARWSWERQRTTDDGASVGEHLALIRKQKPKAAVAIPDGPKLPVEGAYLWHSYLELHDSRDVGFAFGPISEASLYFYAANRNFRWLPQELRVIRALDRAHRIFHADQQSKGPTA